MVYYANQMSHELLVFPGTVNIVSRISQWLSVYSYTPFTFTDVSTYKIISILFKISASALFLKYS